MTMSSVDAKRPPRDPFVLLVAPVFGVLLALAIWYIRAIPPNAAPAPFLTNIPQADLLSGQAFLGDAKSPYTLVEFGDYACGACRLFHRDVKEFLKRNAPRVRYVYRHRPNAHARPLGYEAALVAEEAREEKSFWEAHAALYSGDTLLSREAVSSVRKKLGLRPSVRDTDNMLAAARVDKDMQLSKRLGISRTPTFLLCRPDGKVWRLGSIAQAQSMLR
jgi:protein-disulfide isomerase